MTTQEHRQLFDNTIKVVLTSAFTELQKLGYNCKPNFMCCTGCAFSVLESSEKAVFWTRQDEDAGRRASELWLKWKGDANEIVDVIRKHAVFSPVKVSWSGLDVEAIHITTK